MTLSRLEDVAEAEEALADAQADLETARARLRKDVNARWNNKARWAARHAWLDSIGCRCSKAMRNTGAACFAGTHSSECCEAAK